MLLLSLTACSGPGPVDPGPRAWVAPANEWPSNVPPRGLHAEGFEVGEVVPDARARDQHDDLVALWQFYGEIVLISVSAVWCEPCRDLAAETEDVLRDYAGDGVVMVTVLVEDDGGLDPSLDDATAWAASYGASSPVLWDPDGAYAAALGGVFPVILGIGRDLLVTSALGGGTTDDLRDLIEAEL